MFYQFRKKAKQYFIHCYVKIYNIKHCACINFRKVMSDHQQKVEKLTNTIAQFKQNEDIYRYKLEEINQTRSKIHDEVISLSRDYQKKIKDLKSKLEKTMMENEQLQKQNQLYKRDIEGFEDRLMQKQKLISVLILQQNNMPSIEKSISSKNQENRSETFGDDQKGFRKQPKNKILHNLQTPQYEEKSQVKRNIENQFSQNTRENQETAKFSEQESLRIHSIQSQKGQFSEKSESKAIKRMIPPPPKPKNKITKPTRNIKPISPQINQINIEESKQQPLESEEYNFTKKNDQKQKIQNTFEMEHQNENETEIVQPNNPWNEGENQQNSNQNFFDNLGNKNTGTEQAEQTEPNRNLLASNISSQQFFTQLSNNQEQAGNPMNEIQQSSIDYADNSMISSSTTNMLQAKNLDQSSAKMNKKIKKGKREPVKSVDPTAF